MEAALYDYFGSPDVLQIVTLPDPHPNTGQIRVAVYAAGVNPTDCKARQGLLGGTPPMTTGREVAGVVDEIGHDVGDVVVGDRVFGFSDAEDGAGAAELALVRHYAPIPQTLGFTQVAGLPVVAETAARGLRALDIRIGRTVPGEDRQDGASAGVTDGRTLVINGASGGIGATAVQLAVAAGVHVVGIAGPHNQDFVQGLGAEPVTYGPGWVDRVQQAAPGGIDLALDVAGSGVLPQLVELTGNPRSVVTLSDFPGAKRCGVRFSTGEDGRALDVLPLVADLMATGRFKLPVDAVFPLNDISAAHRRVESGRGRGKVIVTVQPSPH